MLEDLLMSFNDVLGFAFINVRSSSSSTVDFLHDLGSSSKNGNADTSAETNQIPLNDEQS